MIPRYHYRKQIKINYEIQFLINPTLKDEIKKKIQLKKNKQLESAWTSMVNSQLGLCDQDNFLESKLK